MQNDLHEEIIPYKILNLHTDNCAAQNKNVFVLWYLLWRMIDGINVSINLHLLFAGNTKHRCDDAVCIVKRELRRQNVLVPEDLFSIIDESANNNKA